jgi:hypothetical protein
VKARAVDPGLTETVNLLDHSNTESQAPTFEDYRSSLATTVVNHGLQAARRSDPDGFEGAVEAIRDAAAVNYEFTADDVRWPLRGNELGSAFRTLAQAGEIESCGYAVSRRPKAHGRLVRVWRRAVG